MPLVQALLSILFTCSQSFTKKETELFFFLHTVSFFTYTPSPVNLLQIPVLSFPCSCHLGQICFPPISFSWIGSNITFFLSQTISLSQKPLITIKPVDLSTSHCLCSARDVLEALSEKRDTHWHWALSRYSKRSQQALHNINQRDFPSHRSFPYGNSYSCIKHLHTERAAALLRRSGHWNALIWVVYSKLSDDSA